MEEVMENFEKQKKEGGVEGNETEEEGKSDGKKNALVENFRKRC